MMNHQKPVLLVVGKRIDDEVVVSVLLHQIPPSVPRIIRDRERAPLMHRNQLARRIVGHRHRMRAAMPLP